MHLPNLVTTQIRCDYCVCCALFHKTDFPFFVCVLQTNLPALMRQLGDVRNNGEFALISDEIAGTVLSLSPSPLMIIA